MPHLPPIVRPRSSRTRMALMVSKVHLSQTRRAPMIRDMPGLAQITADITRQAEGSRVACLLRSWFLAYVSADRLGDNGLTPHPGNVNNVVASQEAHKLSSHLLTHLFPHLLATTYSSHPRSSPAPHLVRSLLDSSSMAFSSSTTFLLPLPQPTGCLLDTAARTSLAPTHIR